MLQENFFKSASFSNLNASCIKKSLVTMKSLYLILLSQKMSNLQQQRLVVEQLRREAAIKRITVRQAVADIMVNIYHFVLLCHTNCLVLLMLN